MGENIKASGSGRQDAKGRLMGQGSVGATKVMIGYDRWEKMSSRESQKPMAHVLIKLVNQNLTLYPVYL